MNPSWRRESIELPPTQQAEDERDTAARIEDKANEKAAAAVGSNGARRRSRSRSRSRPPALETVEENYSKEVQGGDSVVPLQIPGNSKSRCPFQILF